MSADPELTPRLEIYINNLVQEIKSIRLESLGHLARMKDRTTVKMFMGNPGGKRMQGRYRKRWLDNVENDLG